nr:hypothetical protein Iba_chr08aCG10410 [Ipomoea batatas]
MSFLTSLLCSRQSRSRPFIGGKLDSTPRRQQWRATASGFSSPSSKVAASLSGDRRTPDSFLQQAVVEAGTSSSDLLCFQREQQRLEYPSPRRSPCSNVTGAASSGGLHSRFHHRPFFLVNAVDEDNEDLA